MAKTNIEGTVSIRLKDFLKLQDQEQESEELRARARKTVRELQVFLSFLCTRADIKGFVDEFNRQSTESIIKIEGGRAIIESKYETKDKS